MWAYLIAIVLTSASKVHGDAHSGQISSHRVTTESDAFYMTRSPGSQSKGQLTAAQIEAILNVHNQLRQQQEAADMNRLTWSENLADMAREWSARCDFRHKQPYREDLPYKDIGQTLVASTDDLEPAAIIEAWYDEKQYFDESKAECRHSNCSKLMQLLWSGTKEVGCAYSHCDYVDQVELYDASFLVCNYAPTKSSTERRVYKKGKSCSQCRSNQGWCLDGLCVDSCEGHGDNCVCNLECAHCSQLVAGNCSCLCQAGWVGPECADKCVERSKHCNGNPGWGPDWCDMDGVYDRCPVMCGRCQVADELSSLLPQDCPVVDVGIVSADDTNNGATTLTSLLTHSLLLFLILQAAMLY